MLPPERILPPTSRFASSAVRISRLDKRTKGHKDTRRVGYRPGQVHFQSLVHTKMQKREAEKVVLSHVVD